LITVYALQLFGILGCLLLLFLFFFFFSIDRDIVPSFLG
jgi:hypothetical protein